MIKLLVDADALVALSKSDDTNHQKALMLMRKTKNPYFYVSPYTIPEAVTVLSYHVSQSAAKAFLDRIRTKNLKQLPLTFEIEQETDRVFRGQRKKGTSWFDCFNVALMNSHPLDYIFSFDKFYKKAGLEVLS